MTQCVWGDTQQALSLIPKDRKQQMLDIINVINYCRTFKECNRFGARVPVQINWNLTLLNSLLTSYNDKDVVQWLTFGWPLGRDNSFPQPQWALKNHLPAIQQPQAVEKYLRKEIELGCTMGPFPFPPMGPGPVGCSAISTRCKKNSNEFRIIMDFSFPIGRSVNDQISSTHYMGTPMKLEYPSVDQLAQETAKIGTSAMLWKKDLSRWFKQIKICWKDVPLQGFKWDNTWYFDTSLIMGCCTAPYIAMRCSLALKHIMNQMDYFLVAYADDFSSVAEVNEAWASYNAFGSLLKHLGIAEATEKAVQPSPVLVFLGTGIDAQNQTIFVIPERIVEIKFELNRWRFKTWCTRNELESIISKLQFCTNCVRQGRVFISRLLNQLRNMRRAQYYIIKDETRADLKWWWNFMEIFKSSYILWPEQFKQPGEIISTDASKIAIAGVCGKNYFHARIPEWILLEDPNIANLEFLAIIIAFKKFLAQLKQKSIVIYCDNQAVVEVINNGRTRSEFLQRALREFTMICCHNSIEVKCTYISTHKNLLPDYLSRWYHSSEYHRKFRRATVNRGYKRCHIKPEMFNIINNW